MALSTTIVMWGLLVLLATFLALTIVYVIQKKQRASTAGPKPTLPPTSTSLAATTSASLLRKAGNPSSNAAPVIVTVIGTGLTAAAFAQHMGSRAFVQFREGADRAGGRAETYASAVVPVSTTAAPREFAAWIFHPGVHIRASQFLQAVGVNTTPVTLATPYTFLYTPEQGRLPFGSLPPVASPATSFAEAGGSDPNLWYAHTGFQPADAPAAAADLIARMDLPTAAAVPTGYGWQDAVLRGIGTRPVLYNRQLERLDVLGPAAVRLKYASGDEETVNGPVVLTLPPRDLLHVTTLPADVRDAVSRSFTTVPVGVLYATWAGADVWWAKTGWVAGTVTSTLPIGRVTIVSPSDLRASMSGVDHVSLWNTTLMVEGVEATAALVAAQLSDMFGVVVPPPAAVSFKGWIDGVALWSADANRSQLVPLLQRPWGPSAPVYWASSDLSTEPGWVEGAIEAGQVAAETIATATTGNVPS